MTHYFKSGNAFKVSRDAAIDVRDKLPADNYVIKQTKEGGLFLEGTDPFILPKKIYGETRTHAARILKTYKSRTPSTGVLLSGEKGSGKSLLAKLISMEGAKEGIPTIIVNAPWTGDGFFQLLQDIEQDCIVLFDEFEKIYDKNDQEAILTLFDGVFTTHKLFVITCNDLFRVDQHMHNRPGRMFYALDYAGIPEGAVREFCEDALHDKDQIDSVIAYSRLFYCFSFDMLSALVEEMNRYNEPLEDVVVLLNAKPSSDVETKHQYEVDLKRKSPGPDIRYPKKWQGRAYMDDIVIGYEEFIFPPSAESINKIESYLNFIDDDEQDNAKKVWWKRMASFTQDQFKDIDENGDYTFANENFEVTLKRIEKKAKSFSKYY